ncbi:hypothetical protein L0337_33295 [candidate division KSB1 bacterium]|nr:hypothetical protein [candidate division KSB1 bacterium]
MRKIKLRYVIILIIVGTASSILAQPSSVSEKLLEKPKEQVLVFEAESPVLAEIIGAAALKMSYDSVVVNPSRDKVLIIRSYPQDARQYRILVHLAPLDSAVQLTAQGFWFLAPDSIPRYSKTMKELDHNYLRLFLYAVTQEIALRKNAPLYNKPLPGKSFLPFMGWNLLNPGLASWYMMKDDPTVSRKAAVGWSLFLGVLDAAYVAYYFTPDRERENRQNLFLPWRDLSHRQLATVGAVSLRSVMAIMYWVDQDYKQLKKSGYFFPKLERMSFDTKYTKHIKQSK